MELGARLLVAAQAIELDRENGDAWAEFAAASWFTILHVAQLSGMRYGAQRLHQDTLVKIYFVKRFPRFATATEVRAYVRAAARTVLIDAMREDVDVAAAEVLPGSGLAHSPADLLFAHELIEAVAAALSPEELMLARLMVAGEIPVEEMAAFLGLSNGNLAVRKHRLLDRIKEIIAKEWGL